MQHVRSEVDEGIGRIFLNRQEAVNALSPEMVIHINKTLSLWDQDESIHAIIIEGASGKGFCSGGDLKFMDECSDSELKAYLKELTSMTILLSTLKVPIISITHGYVLGFGVVFLALSDRVIATDDVKIGFPEIHQGRFPFTILAPLEKAIGRRRAFELLLSGRILDASSAYGMGLVHEVLRFDSLSTRVKQMINEMTTYPKAHIAGKKAMLELEKKEYFQSLKYLEDKMLTTLLEPRKNKS